MELALISPLNHSISLSLSLSHPKRRGLTTALCAGSSNLSKVRVCTEVELKTVDIAKACDFRESDQMTNSP